MITKFIHSLALALLIPSGLSLASELKYSKQGPLNFGLVVKNPYHTIYRSGSLGKGGLKDLKNYLHKKELPFPQMILHMNKQGYNLFPMMSVFAIDEYELQSKYNYQFFHSFDYNYRIYVDGHNPYEPKKDIDDEKLLNSKARKYFGVIDDGEVDGGMDAFKRVMNLVLGSHQPVLFHCTGGLHRTGMTALAIRYIQGGEWLDGPSKRVTVNVLGPTLDLNPAQYEYFLHNGMSFRPENLAFIEEFSQDPFFDELVLKYRASLNGKAAPGQGSL